MHQPVPLSHHPLPSAKGSPCFPGAFAIAAQLFSCLPSASRFHLVISFSVIILSVLWPTKANTHKHSHHSSLFKREAETFVNLRLTYFIKCSNTPFPLFLWKCHNFILLCSIKVHCISIPYVFIWWCSSRLLPLPAMWTMEMQLSVVISLKPLGINPGMD